MWFFRQVGAAVFDGFSGGLNVTNIISAMDGFGIPQRDRAWMLKQVSVFVEKRYGKQS